MAELVVGNLRLAIMHHNQNALATLQAINGHQISRNAVLAHPVDQSDNGIDVIEIGLNLRMRHLKSIEGQAFIARLLMV